MEYLALEWLRDKRALWQFLGDAFARWKQFQNPTSTRHKSVVMHQLFGSELSCNLCAKPMAEIVDRLMKQGP